MSERVLITGASGFVGYHLIEAALKAGFEVHGAIRKSSDVSHLSGLDIQYVYPDYNNAESLQKELETGQYSYIIHSAGVTRAKNEAEYNKINAAYTRNLAQAAQHASIPLSKFVFISSLAAMGPTFYEDINPITELSKAEPVTNYGRSKLLAEQYLAEIKELPLIVLRPTAVYGPREKDIYIMFKTLKSGLEPYIGTKGQRLSFIYAKDLANVAMKALVNPGNHVAYNISDGNSYERYELADLTKKILGKKTLKFHVPLGMVKALSGILELTSPKDKTPVLNSEKLAELTAENWNCSIEKLKKDMGYVPAYDLERGLEETLKWYQSNNWL